MDTHIIKTNLKAFYDREAESRDSNSVKTDWKVRVREQFRALAKQENKSSLLELGAGAGHDSRFFMDNGFKVTAVDLSGEMVRKCLEKGIEAYEMDFYDLSSLNRRFDCVYAMNTLLHVPKADLPRVLREIDAVLAKGGLFYMGLYGGEDTESEFVKRDVSDTPRFFALHSEDYLKKTAEEVFDILDFERLSIDTHGDVDVFHSMTLLSRK